MLAAIVSVEHLVETAGYPLLFVVVMAESSGVPVPGETGLITAGILSSSGKLQIELVIVIAAAAAIVGDNIGYLIGRKGGRWVLERPGAFERQRKEVLLIGEPFFERHGPKAVFFGRFILGLRVWASWLAGATRMHWRSFALWNALGGICWATGIGLIAYFLGRSADNAIKAFGLYGLAAAALALFGLFVMHRRARRRAEEMAAEATEGGTDAGTDTDTAVAAEAAGAEGAADGARQNGEGAERAAGVAVEPRSHES
jgi:membrane protein DedA with SNARE-associated domain